MDATDFFRGHKEARAIYRAILGTTEHLKGVKTRASKSQIGFYRAHPFASVWKPKQYLKGEHPPLVLTIFLHCRDHSGRWKEIVEPAPGRFTHHLELNEVGDVDEDVRGWIRQAWKDAA